MISYYLPYACSSESKKESLWSKAATAQAGTGYPFWHRMHHTTMSALNTSDNNPKDPTANYRKYPKGPNFLNIVIMAGVILLVLLVVAVFLVKSKGKSMEPHPPNPTPNSLVQPLLLKPDASPLA